MKITVITEDSLVGIDGEFRQVNLSGLDPDISVIQWENSAGEIEYKDKEIQNISISDASVYQWIIDAWVTAGIVDPIDPVIPTQEEIDEASLENSTKDLALVVTQIAAALIDNGTLQGTDFAPSVQQAYADLKVIADRLISNT